MSLSAVGRRVVRKVYRTLFPAKPSEWQIRVERDERLIRRLIAGQVGPRSTCVDIGANKGDILEQFIAAAPQGQFLAFEPIPVHAQSLRERFPAVEVFDIALSDRDGAATFYYVPNRDAWSGLQKQRYPDAAQPTEIRVQLRRLDEVVGPDRCVDFIKVDVEGAELEVLQGAVATLKRCRPMVLFEHAKLHNENYSTTPEQVYRLLVDECGMEVLDLGLTRVFDRQAFIELYEASYASNYDRNAQTNFVARYPEA